MSLVRVITLLSSGVLLSSAPTLSGAQVARTRSPSRDGAVTPAAIERNATFPYAGIWAGSRVMPVGSDEVRFRFSVADGQYTAVMIHPLGETSPPQKAVSGTGGISWEEPNSGGGIWVYHVRLVALDSMVGTLVLRDGPRGFTPVPRGTMTLTRQPVAPARRPR